MDNLHSHPASIVEKAFKKLGCLTRQQLFTALERWMFFGIFSSTQLWDKILNLSDWRYEGYEDFPLEKNSKGCHI
ncbi:hypothetical protein EYC84_001973 [Monilinia fructicola]|uniref:Uncharacterized protein n=1 Tax=Monilinia fructicola TaxID=38448 RepID=A0A5M9JZC0_MONFR|nr:hypothetical protein EYC84_001973 [Monilinia fructicola]